MSLDELDMDRVFDLGCKQFLKKCRTANFILIKK
jgi:hypothetical protein